MHDTTVGSSLLICSNATRSRISYHRPIHEKEHSTSILLSNIFKVERRVTLELKYPEDLFSQDRHPRSLRTVVSQAQYGRMARPNGLISVALRTQQV
jgi:hypothetical protein